MSNDTSSQNQWPPPGHVDRPMHRFSSEAALRWADLVGIEADLISSKQMLERQRAVEDETIKFALLSAALIKFRRAFSSGVRTRLIDEDIDGLGQTAPDFHKYMIDVASKFIAHSVNSFEQTAVVITTDEEAQKIHAVGTFHVHAIDVDPRNIPVFIELIDLILQRKIAPRIEEAKRICTAEAYALGYSEIKKLQKLEFVHELPDKAGSSRKIIR